MNKEQEKRLLALLQHCKDTLNSSDADHPDFFDSGCDSIDLFWSMEHEINALHRELIAPAPVAGKFDATIALLQSKPLEVETPKAYKPTFSDRLL